MIGVVGISHKTAGVDVREMFAINSSQMQTFTRYLLQLTEIDEVFVLSTCNRTEVYFYKNCTCGNRSIRLTKEWLHEFHHITNDYSDQFYAQTNIGAIKHLFDVASGIDSMLIGEYQIVKQIKDAYDQCNALGTTGVILKRLLNKALETGKLVRTQTEIQKGAISVGYAAIDLCVQTVDNLPQKSVLLVGAGETIKLAIYNLLKKGVRKFTIVNRTFEAAKALANQYKGEARPFDELPTLLPHHDIVITATDAGKLLITKKDVEVYAAGNNPQLMLDLSVPRNIDDAINELEHIKVCGIDAVSEVINTTRQNRQNNLQKAHEIIDEKVHEFLEWKSTRALRPIISRVTENLNKIHLDEMEVIKETYSGNEVNLLEAHSARLTKKYIRNIIKQLKKISATENDPQALEKIYNLFEFNEK